MGATSRAHRGVTTRAHQYADNSFQAFCDRQRSRVANFTQQVHRRYVTRVLTHLESEKPDITVKGVWIAGSGKHRGRSEHED